MYAPAPLRSSMSNAMPLAEDVLAQEAARAGGCDRVDQPVPAQRVLAAQVQVAALAAGGDAGDRHRLDDEERVVLEDHAVLERPRLGLVGVADQVVRALGVAGHRLPLAAGRERGAAAAHQLRVASPRAAPGRAPSRSPRAAPPSRRGRGSCRCSRDRRRRRGAAAAATDRPPAGRAAPARAAASPPASRLAMSSAVTGATEASCGSSPATVNMAAGARSHMPRHGLSCQTACPLPGCCALGPDRALELGHQLLRAARDAGHVGADVRDHGRLGLEREQRVERRHAVGLRRRDRQPPADVVQRAAADPARRAPARRAAWAAAGAAAPAPRGRRGPRAGRARTPARRPSQLDPGRTEHGVDRLALRRRRELVLDDDVHQVTGCSAAGPPAATSSPRARRRRSGRRGWPSP